jgi:hypothetical protein
MAMVLLLPAAAGRPRRASRTRHGCGSAAIWLQPCATQRHGAMWCGKAQLSIRPGRSARLAPGPSSRRARSSASPPQGQPAMSGTCRSRRRSHQCSSCPPQHRGRPPPPPGSGPRTNPEGHRPNRPDPGTQAATRRVPSAAVSRVNKPYNDAVPSLRHRRMVQISGTGYREGMPNASGWARL